MERMIKMNTIPDSQIQVMGISALKEKLGVVDTLRFLQQFDNGGTGDYTAEKYLKDDVKLSKEEMMAQFNL